MRRDQHTLELAIGHEHTSARHGHRRRASETAAPCARATTATLATGWGTVIPRLEELTGCAGSQRVEPSAAMSPICVPAASRPAWASGTTTRDTSVALPRYQVAR